MPMTPKRYLTLSLHEDKTVGADGLFYMPWGWLGVCAYLPGVLRTYVMRDHEHKKGYLTCLCCVVEMHRHAK
jgi:hypothetical protein